MTETEENGSKTEYQSLITGEDSGDDSGPANRPIIDKPEESVNKNWCKCPNRNRQG